MRRRGKANNTQGKGALGRRARKASTNRVSTADLQGQVAALTLELQEAREQQTATADVLKIISASPGDMTSVFEAMLSNAMRLCEAKFGHLLLYDGERFHAAYLHDVPLAYREYWRTHGPIRPGPNTGLGRIVSEKRMFHIPDLKAEAAYAARDSLRVVTVEQAGARSFVGVPMLKDDKLMGAIVIYRQEVRPFTDRQIELLQNFAAQAVIAIENTRLLSELRQRTGDLSEALEQQTATSEVLKVISSSPGELETVFQTLLENATRICEAAFGSMLQREGDVFRRVALHNAPPAFAQFHNQSPTIQWREVSDLRRVVETKQVIHVADTAAEHPDAPIAKYAGGRTLLLVPMLKDKDLVGVIGIYRQEVRPFTDKQIELVQNFAAQAVIAIENTRLLSELRESLQQQTATADVLKVISRSTFDLQTVLDTLVESAARLCGAEMANIWRPRDGAHRLTASYGVTARNKELLENKEFLNTIAIEPGRGTTVGRVLVERKTVHIHDIQADPDYKLSGLVALGGTRTMLGVPMLREGDPIGVLVLVQSAVRPFTDKQIELATTFADQAVIAIENTRLLNELRESLQQQTATADVLKVISRSTFDLQVVLDTLTASAARLCITNRAAIFLRNGELYRIASVYGFTDSAKQYAFEHPMRAGRGTVVGRVALSGKVNQVPDVFEDPEYEGAGYQKAFGFRTNLGVPLLRDGTTIGVLSLTRDEVKPFSDSQIELLATFADQAVIAIENVRLFESVGARTRELAQSLHDLRTTQDRLVQTQKLASLGQLTAGIAHEIKNPLNFVNNFSGVSAELVDELQEALKDWSLNEKRRDEVAELMETLRSNLDKVVQHGKRADAIVKNMLLHSHQGSGEHRPVAINAIVEESLKLAYHGARAEKDNFNVMVEQSLDPVAGEADIFPQEITRVLLNLISNGVYATKKKAPRDGNTYKPTLTASTKSLGDHVEISIRDNGMGIPPEVKDKMFNPFFTTKPAGEGTGLGLSISHDIIVKQHGGSIEVDTEPGEFTEVRIVLPRLAAFVSK
jgi:GAF domain-containing protein